MRSCHNLDRSKVLCQCSRSARPPILSSFNVAYLYRNFDGSPRGKIKGSPPQCVSERTSEAPTKRMQQMRISQTPRTIAVPRRGKYKLVNAALRGDALEGGALTGPDELYDHLSSSVQDKAKVRRRETVDNSNFGKVNVQASGVKDGEASKNAGLVIYPRLVTICRQPPEVGRLLLPPRISTERISPSSR